MEFIHDATDFQTLCGRLSNNDPSIDIVSLTSYGSDEAGFIMTDTDTKELARCLEQNTHVTEIYINIRKLSVFGGIALMQYVISNSKLLILGLQGSLRYIGEELMDNQIVVTDVLVRAAIQNPSHLTLEIGKCRIARSTLLACMLQSSESNSLLSEISLDNCEMVVDNEDPILEEYSYNSHLEDVGITSFHDNSLSDFLIKCLLQLPNLKRLYLTGDKSLPKCSFSKFQSLRYLSYIVNPGYPAPKQEPYNSIIKYVQDTDTLEQISLSLDGISTEQITNLRRAFNTNHSIKSIWQSTSTSMELQSYCERNRRFLKEFKDMTKRIHPSLFPFVAEIGVKSSAGRTACFMILPLIVMGSPR
jgi:hypothetical protein